MQNNLKNSKKRINLKYKISSILELPKEIVLDLPSITIIGRQEITIQNYKSIIEYSDEVIRINTSSGIFKIIGKNMILKLITDETISIKGFIHKTEFVNL